MPGARLRICIRPPTGPGHCVIYPNSGVPRIFCQHTSCTTHVDSVNRQLWTRSRPASGIVAASPIYDKTEKHARQQKQRERELLERHAVALFPSIQLECHWPADAIKADSPVAISSLVPQHYYYILDLFEDDDVLWCADEVNRTGWPWHKKHFRRVSRWMAGTRFPGAFTCPSTFDPGAFSRSEANVGSRKFLVVESDNILDRDHVGAVFRWLDKHLKLPLRAVVDTGNKSLHGWFEYPSEGLLEKLAAILPAFGCDRAMFKPAQPCRMPGVIRPETGRWQELLYFAPSPARTVDTNPDISSSDEGIAL